MILYTSITNGYFQLPQLDLDCRCVCFHDGSVEEQEGWELEYIPGFSSDPVRMSRIVKMLCPFDEPNVYIDASKLHTLNNKFCEVSEFILSQDSFTVIEHPHCHRYREECAEYICRGLVPFDDVYKFTVAAAEAGYNFKDYLSPLCTILWRRGKTDFDQLWWDWYLKGGRRDQLSFAVALQMGEVKYNTVPARDLIDVWSDASHGGEWWANKGGKYGAKYHVNPEWAVDILCKVTGLEKNSRNYRCAVVTEGDEPVWLFGDMSSDFDYKYKKLNVLNPYHSLLWYTNRKTGVMRRPNRTIRSHFDDPFFFPHPT